MKITSWKRFFFVDSFTPYALIHPSLVPDTVERTRLFIFEPTGASMLTLELPFVPEPVRPRRLRRSNVTTRCDPGQAHSTLRDYPNHSRSSRCDYPFHVLPRHAFVTSPALSCQTHTLRRVKPIRFGASLCDTSRQAEPCRTNATTLFLSSLFYPPRKQTRQ